MVKRLAKEHIYIVHAHRQQCGEGQGRGKRRLGESGDGGKWAISVIVNKLIVKIKKK